MAVNYPGSLDTSTTLPNPSATNDTNSPSLAGGQDNQNAAIIAIETKLGIESSTPTSGMLLAGVGSGQSTWTVAYPNGTIVGTTDTQTLTNKTISPTNNTISGLQGSNLANQTITATQIANATITATQLAADSVTAPKMTNSGTWDTTWAWTSYTPTFTNWTIGTGGSAGTTARYTQIGKTVWFRIETILGSSGQSVGSGVSFTLPVTMSATNYSVSHPIGQCQMQAAGLNYFGEVFVATTTTASISCAALDGSYLGFDGLTSTVPNTWAASDYLYISGYYEAA